MGVKYTLCSVFIVCYQQEKLLGKALSLSLCSLTVFSCSSCTVEVGEVVAPPFLLFLPFFSFALLPKHSRILVCRKMHTIPCVCCFVLCTAQLSMPLFSLSSLCRTHRAPILISNGAKHKQSLAPVLDSPFYFHLSEEADMRQNHMFE